MIRAALSIQLRLDLVDLSVDLWVVLRKAITPRNGSTRAVMLTLTIVPSWAFLHKEHAEHHDGRPEEADSHWKTPSAGTIIFFCAEVDAVCGEDTQGDE